MNIKYSYKSRGEKKQKLISLDEFCNQVKNCKYQKLRDSLKYKLGASINLENTKFEETERLPHVFFSVGKAIVFIAVVIFALSINCLILVIFLLISFGFLTILFNNRLYKHL